MQPFLSLHFHALCLILASVAAIEALVALWAGSSRRPVARDADLPHPTLGPPLSRRIQPSRLCVTRGDPGDENYDEENGQWRADGEDEGGLAASINNPDRRVTTETRLLQTDLAIRLYQNDNGRLPATLDELVPGYLSVIPLDAYVQKQLIYRFTGDTYLLYSVGHDEIDNGGKFTNMHTYYSRDSFDHFKTGYDFDLDTNTRP